MGNEFSYWEHRMAVSDSVQNPGSFLYKLQDFYRKANGSYMVVAKEEGNPRGVFKIPATELVSVRKDLLSKFNLDDKINIIGLATIEQPPAVVIKKSNHLRYFPLLAMIFGSSLITSNIASSKLVEIYGTTLTAGTLPYLITYVIGGIITEVYGYKKTRQLIWGAILCNLLTVLFIMLAINSPPSPFWSYQKEYALTLGAVPQVIFASLISYFSGEFLNSYLIAKLKILQEGKKLWVRIVLSSIAAMTIDNFLFLFIAYFHMLPFTEMLRLSCRSYLLGLLFEWSAIPILVIITAKLKSIENMDIFDINTNFTPFSLDTDYLGLNNRSAG